VPSPYRRRDAETFIGRVAPDGWADGSSAIFGVFDRADGRVLGSVGLHRIADGSGELGFWAAPEARGAGVTTAAAWLVCHWGLGPLGLERIVWQAEVGNAPSRRVAEKLGFTVEGVLRRGLVHRGRRIDGWTGSLLPGELPTLARLAGPARA
jgi:RimJ/RimL family protein N-acetyltransferase